MPFDPTLPLENTEIDAVQMRAQLNGLKALIDAVPGITGAALDGVTTGNPGDPASVNLSIISSVLHFSFTIPRGDDGAQGPPFASAVVDAVNTLPPTDPATVVSSFDGTDVHFTFGIPKGDDGVSGAPITSFIVDSTSTLAPGTNAQANASFDGTSVRLTFGIPQGIPGEVSNAALTTAINGTSSNSNAVATIPNAAPPDYDQTLMQLVLDKVNELITTLHR